MKERFAWSVEPSPLGDLLLAATAGGLVALRFLDREGPEPHLADLSTQGLDPATPPDATARTHLRQASAQLREYFAGRRRRFDLTLDLRGTPFQMSVWKALQQIPYGETWSYGRLARAVRRPAAARAAGAANGKNPVAIVLPCHRVVGADGSLTGFGGGLHRKAWLLRHERGDHLPFPPTGSAGSLRRSQPS